MSPRPERPSDAEYHERDRVELLSQGDPFRDVPRFPPPPLSRSFKTTLRAHSGLSYDPVSDYLLGVRHEPAHQGAIHLSPGPWLLAFAVAVIVGHHTGVLFEPLGRVRGIAGGETRWADWIDLILPYVVVGFAGAALATAATPRRVWLLFGFAAVLYTQGHGIHLAANSIGNVAPGEPAHLWDELVGHYLWYGGLAGLVAVLGFVLGDLPRPSWRVGLPVTLLFGFTVFTNSIEGGTAPLGLVSSSAFLVWGIYRRERLLALLVPAYGLALVALAGWGIYWLGFPQFSELGWL